MTNECNVIRGTKDKAHFGPREVRCSVLAQEDIWSTLEEGILCCWSAGNVGEGGAIDHTGRSFIYLLSGLGFALQKMRAAGMF